MRILSFYEFLNEAANSELYAVGAKGEEVKKIQQKLIELGLLKAKSPTGYYGPDTEAAVKQFQDIKQLKADGMVGAQTMPILLNAKPADLLAGSYPKVSLPADLTAARSDTFSPYDTAAQEKGRQIEIMRQVRPILKKNNISEPDFERGNWLIKLIKKSMKSIPLHIRAVIYYIAGRTSEMNEDELTPEERSYLYQAAQRATNGFNYDYWKSLGAANLPTAVTPQGIQQETTKLKQGGQGSLAAPNLAGQFMYTIGSVSKGGILKAGNSITVKDNYDMNVVEAGAKTEDLLKGVANAIDLWADDKASLYTIIRQSISLREVFGYKGYPVKFDLAPPSQTA
jgi:peptidoglycan hydrolase-like protein with peptidoglycan-binding domain